MVRLAGSARWRGRRHTSIWSRLPALLLQQRGSARTAAWAQHICRWSVRRKGLRAVCGKSGSARVSAHMRLSPPLFQVLVISSSSLRGSTVLVIAARAWVASAATLAAGLPTPIDRIRSGVSSFWPWARVPSLVCCLSSCSRVLSRASVRASGRFFCLFVCLLWCRTPKRNIGTSPRDPTRIL